MIDDTLRSGALLAAIPIAVLGGLVSFFSPCVLPLVPGYLGYVTGLSGADLKEAKRGRVLAGAALFVLGFTAVFVSGGALFGYFGSTLLAHADVISRILGALTIIAGLIFAGILPFGLREFRFHVKPATGLIGAPFLGALFGIGWTPCSGPTLAAVNSLAFTEASAARGAILGTAYCFGLGIPFLIAAVALRRTLSAFSWFKKNYVWVVRIGGGILIMTGVLLVTGAWSYVIQAAQTWSANFTTEF